MQTAGRGRMYGSRPSVFGPDSDEVNPNLKVSNENNVRVEGFFLNVKTITSLEGKIYVRQKVIKIIFSLWI